MTGGRLSRPVLGGAKGEVSLAYSPRNRGAAHRGLRFLIIPEGGRYVA